MTDPAAPPAAPPARHVPPSGLRVTLVLLAIVFGIAFVCVACLLSYMFYVDARQR